MQLCCTAQDEQFQAHSVCRMVPYNDSLLILLLLVCLHYFCCTLWWRNIHHTSGNLHCSFKSSSKKKAMYLTSVVFYNWNLSMGSCWFEFLSLMLFEQLFPKQKVCEFKLTLSYLLVYFCLIFISVCTNESHRAWTLEYNWNAGVILISICHGKIEKQGENVEMNKLIHMQNVYNIVGVQFSSSKLIAIFFRVTSY